MNSKIAQSLCFLALAGMSFSSGAAEYLVKYKSSAGFFQALSVQSFSQFGVAAVDAHEPGQYVVMDVADDQKTEGLEALVSNPGVEYVVPNFKIEAFRAPINPLALKEQWAMGKVQAQKAWDRAGNNGVTDIIVAVIDTGIDYNHESLSHNMVDGYDFRDNDADPMDETSNRNPGHGTHCAGIVGASGLVDGGIVGMGPGLSMMPIRFLGKDGSGDLNGAIKSIDFAIEKGAQVISASWGAAVPRAQAAALIEAVQRADDAGVIFVAAAANDGKNNDKTEVFPTNAGTPNMIAVAASTSSDAKPSWSNYGTATVHLASPGERIMSTLPGNKYGNLSGTSMATPLVSGLVGFILSQNADLTGAQIRSLLQTTGAKVNIETACNCRVDAFVAVDHLLGEKAWIVPAAASIEKSKTLQMEVVNGTAPFTFKSTDEAILTVSAEGQVTGVADGSATISVTDANGTEMSTLAYHVGPAKSGGGGGGGGDGGECPLGDPALCEALCGIIPDAPFCKK